MTTLLPQTKDAILIVDDAAFSSILRRQREDGVFARFDLRRASDRKERFSTAYYAECFRAFGILPAYAERLKPYLVPAYLAEQPKGDAATWNAIARHLIDTGVLKLPVKLRRPVELVNGPDLEPCMTDSAKPVIHAPRASIPWKLLFAPDERSQLRFAVQLAAKWLEEGIRPERIAIANVLEQDAFLLATLARRYGFSVALRQRTPLIRLSVVALFWQRIQSEDPVATIEALFPDETDPIRAELLEIATLYDGFSDPLPFWRFELERRNVVRPSLSGAVRIISWEDLNVFEDAHTIVLNACEGLFPTLRQDDGLCPDETLPKLGMRTSIAENERRRTQVKQAVEAILDLILIAPDKRGGSPVAAVETDRFDRPHVVIAPEDDWLACSERDAQFLRAAMTFDQKTYGITSSLLRRLDASLPSPTPYDPRFKGIDAATNNRLWKHPHVLSASSLETYFACRFRYLLTHLLHMEPKISSLSASLGTAVHRRLENLAGFSTPVQLTHPEFGPARLRTFEVAVDRRLERVVAHLMAHLSQSTFADAGAEKTLEARIADHDDVILRGRIDRIMTVRFDDRDYVAVIDFKTGQANFSPDDFERGTDLQLMVYWELIRKQPEFATASLAGFFYQPVALNRLNETDGADDFAKRMKMSGYVLDRTDVAKAFDAGGFVRGFQIKNDGTFHANVKRFDQDRLEGWLVRLQTHLQNAIAQIEQGDYRITPIAKKPGASESVSCQYCPFAGICYLANKQSGDEATEADREEAEEWAD